MCLIPNNGWETGDAGGWTLNNGGGGGSAAVSSASPRSGAYHLRLTAVSGFTASSATYQFADHQSIRGYQVTLTVRGKTTSGLRTANIQISDGVGGATTANIDTGAAYVETSITRTINAASTLLQFSITQAGSGAGVHDIDDMEVVVKDAGGNVVFASDLIAQPGALGSGGGGAYAIYGVEVDWDNDDVWTESGNAISADVKSMGWERGMESELEHVGTGTLELVVRNETGKYSPENTASALSPNVLPGRPIRVRAIYDGTLYNLFIGYIEKIVPRPRAKEAYILCVDGMDRLARNTINAPSRGIIGNIALGSGVTMGSTVQVSGVDITFANANPDTITRASGSFVDDGFLAGMRVRVAGSTLNNSGTGLFPPGFVIAGVTALVLTMHADEGLQAEGPVAGVTLDGYGPVGIILDEAGWPFAKRSLDQGIDTLDLWWAHKEKPLDAIQKLMDVEKSLAYVNGAGNFVYENRHHRLKGAHLTSQGTFSDTMVEMEYEVSSRPIRNIAVLTGHERTAAAATTRLWGTRDRPRIEQGGVEIIWAHLENPAAVINVPAATTDYRVSDSPTGSPDATLLANLPAIFTKYGQSVKMQFTNNNSKDVYIIPGTIDANYALYIDGQEYEDDEAFVKEEDSDSKTAYGDRSIDIENPFVGSFNPLQAYAEWLVSRFKGINAAGTKVPMPDNVRIHLMNGSSALLTQILAREISDRITLTVTDLGVSAKEYYINKMRHEVSDGGMLHECTFWLERVDELKYWILETAGYGELEETTRVGF